MEHFISKLEAVLVDVARDQSAQGLRTRDGSRRRRPGRILVATAAVVLVVVAGGSARLGGSDHVADAQTLPALRYPAHGAESMRGRLPDALVRSVNLAQARSFKSSAASGFVLPSDDGDSVCLVLADAAGYGSTCAPIARVREHGLVGQSISPSPDAGPSRVAIVLPNDAPTPVLRYDDGSTEVVHIDHGVATATVRASGVLTVGSGDATQTLRLRAFEPQGEFAVDCGNGRIVKVPAQADTAQDRRSAVCDYANTP
ncbi:MAG TPA: hypothetical protein VFG42_09095 [Baekduia sp.]|uniref:hypothetical protein n=1 Tax=Baekduia sp. TaxID=2600305 RepID=UPI002D7688AD|nr:hypothetical protein [Baekduia sp.]HET6506932.1 hypothetical protein [Baekduia sp.]